MVILSAVGGAAALTPQQVAVVANAADKDSVAIAAYYARIRGIPAGNVVSLRMPTGSKISRSDYDRLIRVPLARKLKNAGLADKIKSLCLIRGVPIGIVPAAKPKGKSPAKAKAGKDSDATVDSELAMLWLGSYKLAGPAANPLYWKNAAKFPHGKAPKVLTTARIDAPSRADAVRIIKASASAEKAGLRGTFYIDAGGRVPEYDGHLLKLHRMITARTKLPSVLDKRRSVFRPNSCPKAALYVGWSSPGRYVPAFSWVPGAVGWHIAGDEAHELRQPDSRRWCPKMIQNGVAATIGAVGEPRLGALPKPEEFFALLLTGKYTLAECYWRTVPHASWRMTLIGDPLYTPFKKNPQLPVSALPRGLAIPK